MGHFLSKKSKANPPSEQPHVTPTITTITRLRKSISNIEKREGLLTKKMKHAFHAASQEKKAGNRAAAIAHMRRKHLYEKENNKLESMKLNLEQQIFTLESAQTNIHTISAMKAGQETMKTLVAENTIETLETLREDIEEQHENTREINTLISEPMGALMDDDELEKELNDILEEETVTELEKTLTSKEEILPSVPKNIPTLATIEEEKELEELEREMTLA